MDGAGDLASWLARMILVLDPVCGVKLGGRESALAAKVMLIAVTLHTNLAVPVLSQTLSLPVCCEQYHCHDNQHGI